MLGKLLQLLREAGRAYLRSNPSRMAAAISFYAAFSMAPLMVGMVLLTRWYAVDPGFDHYLSLALADVMGPQNAHTLLGVAQMIRSDQSSLPASLFGLWSLVFGASGVFVEVQGALNTIWEAHVEESFLWGYLRQRMWTFLALLGLSVLVLASILSFVFLTVLANYFERHQDLPVNFLRTVHGLVTFLLFSLLFAKLYKLLPDVQLWWRDVLLGGLVTSFFFTLGKVAMAWYLGRFGLSSVYGPAAALVAILFWLFYSAQTFLFGAHFTCVYARTYGSLAPPPGSGLPPKTPPPKPRKKRRKH